MGYVTTLGQMVLPSASDVKGSVVIISECVEIPLTASHLQHIPIQHTVVVL
ncbi:unnamed protein product [Penicillium salamii]|uniref:Uncharacterized protein n=1 Tax=Penicillium salamii TaxID=1612424 RepID=A0A9W4IX42_9EURO|nr:unnamed protein product [Penicillium salamii]CAG8014994.1 unnamed protein product [Penicillium salamii]CAG8022240.1 unnamed protein product [Penicillium salamii]CAG8308710.1 unnamed protein product [Penicillium salamii]CAG8328118.1 unnamed protein product [Penicillium salamii]